MSEKAALEKVVELCGGQSALADRLGTKQGNVWYWLNKTGRIHHDYVLKAEQAVNSQVTRHELRPDLYPAGGAA